ncbi:MAG: hypothetical protein U1F76_06595 [Candidatus Competibacteraceae bacterium]
MNEIITFFRNFEQDQGRTYRLIIQLPDKAYSLSIYSRLFFQKSEFFSDQEFKDTESYYAYKAQLINLIGQSNGGFLVEVRDGNEHLEIKIQAIGAAESEGWSPPRQVFYLEPGYRLTERPFDGTELDLKLSKDSHLILPVDEDAEKHFRSFRENYSSWFPADFEPIMLNLLRQPTLDLRVARLEEKLEEKSLEEKAQEKPKEQPAPVTEASDNVALSKQDTQPSPLMVTTLILAGILAATGIYGYENLVNNINMLKASMESINTKINKSPVATSTASTPLQISPSPVTETQYDSSVKGLSGAVNDLLVLLSKERQQGKDPNINKLWDKHFSGIQNIGNLDQNMVSDLFKRKEFLWGMIKLPIVEAQSDTNFLENVDAISATASIYREILDSKQQNAINSDEAIRTMLAFLTCQVQEIENTPRLKTVIMKYFFIQSVTIFKAEPCTNLKIEDALPGMIKMKSELEKNLPVSGHPEPK